MAQKEVFLQAEGDSFYRRNQNQLSELQRDGENDPVLHAIKALSLKPRSVLEIGCSNGWRLELIRQGCNALCHGIEPSAEAVAAGKSSFPELLLKTGTAERLDYEAGTFDLVIFGFCLYLCDRQDLFRIAAEADRVLAEGGHLAFLDFSPPFPYRNVYKHREGLYSYKMDHTRMFLWNPAYTVLSQTAYAHPGARREHPDERLCASVLLKRLETAYPDNPYVR